MVFPMAVSQIRYHAPVPSPQTAELLQLNFPKKDSLQEVIQHYFFKQNVNVSYFSKSTWLYFEFSRTVTDDAIDEAANTYTDNEPPSWGFKHTEFNTRGKGPSVAQLTHLACRTRSRELMGKVIMNITLGPQSNFRTKIKLLEPYPCSCSWHHLEWLLPYPPVLRSTSDASNPHSVVLTFLTGSYFLPDLQTE